MTTREEIAQLMAKFVIIVGGKTTSNLNAMLSQSVTQESQSRLMVMVDVLINAEYMR